MKKMILLIGIAVLLLANTVQAKPVKSWENSGRVDWEYLYNGFVSLYQYHWHACRGDKEYRGYLDLNKDGQIDIFDIGTLNWILVKAIEG